MYVCGGGYISFCIDTIPNITNCMNSVGNFIFIWHDTQHNTDVDFIGFFILGSFFAISSVAVGVPGGPVSQLHQWRQGCAFLILRRHRGQVRPLWNGKDTLVGSQ